MSLIPKSAMEGAARALGYGAQKYNDYNYRKGLKHRRVADALLRHLMSWLENEDLDPESGLSHIDHVLANACLLSWLIENKPELNDRWNKDE